MGKARYRSGHNQWPQAGVIFCASSFADDSGPAIRGNRTCWRIDVIATVRGGGLSGQAGAVRHGISRALTL